MKQINRNKLHMLKEKSISAKDWIMDHTKIVMPLVLVVCVLITVFVALNANQKEALEKEVELASVMAAQTEGASPSVDGISSPEFELQENAYQDVNEAVRTYYDAQAEGDIETISSLNTYLNDIEKIRVEEMSKYIESYPVLNVYTKPGLSENTYIAYVYSEVQFTDVEQALPGMQTYYIGKNEDGSFFVNDGTYDDTIWNYIKEVTLQDDVVDLNNKVVVAYNELLESDEELNEFIAYLKEKINEEVGEILAKAEQPETETEAAGEEVQTAAADASGQESAEGEAETGETTADTIKTVKATDVVNIRSSDSETADKLDKAQVGQEFTLLEERGNGWSKVEYDGKEAFIKSDYLEVVAEEALEETSEETSEEGSEETEEEASDEEEEEASEETGEASSSESAEGTVTVLESVKVRKSASTSADSLGTVYAGETLELLMKQADGWTKVKYKGETAYVKSEYVE